VAVVLCVGYRGRGVGRLRPALGCAGVVVDVAAAEGSCTGFLGTTAAQTPFSKIVIINNYMNITIFIKIVKRK
jgi:hypothetical protein